MRIRVVPPTKKKQAKLRVCAYARVSTDSQEQEDSLENQTAYYQQRIESNPEWEFAGVYSDEGISGFVARRPGFQRMLADARAGKFNLILVKSISRFARNTQTLLEATRELKALGIGVVFELQEINTLTSAGELMLTIKGAFFQAESESASQGAKLITRHKFERLEHHHKSAETYGYRPDEHGNIVIDEGKATVVRRIFDMAERGVWNSKIKDALNKENIPAPNGGKWDDTGIARVLHNVMYKGDLILQKYTKDSNRVKRLNRGEQDQWYITDNHPAIVSPEQWDRVQEKLAERRKHLDTPLPPAPATPRSSRTQYPLTNMLYCPRCGEKLLHKWSNGRREYWACKTNIKVSAAACKGIWLPGTVANTWGEITEPVTVIQYQDNDGMDHFTAIPKDEYEAFSECPYGKEKQA